MSLEQQLLKASAIFSAERDQDIRELQAQRQDILIEAISDYSKNPDTFNQNIDRLKGSSNVTRDDKRYIDILQRSYKFKKPEKNKKEIKQAINKFSLSATGLNAFAKFREFKLFSIENGIQENDEVIKKLTSLADASDKYTKNLQRDTAEGEAYITRSRIGNILSSGGSIDDAFAEIGMFNQKWGDRDFGEQLSEQIKTDASRMFALNELSKRESMNDLNAIQNKNAVGLEIQQARVTQAKRNAKNGNIGVDDGMALYSSGSLDLPDIVEKVQEDKSALDKNRKGWVATVFGTVDKSQEKIANNVISKLSDGSRLKNNEISLLISKGKFKSSNIDAYHALNGQLTPEEGQKYAKRADEANRDIEYLSLKKELTPEQEDILAELKGKQQEDISFAVAAGQSTAISSNIANRIISEQTKIPLNETRARNERVAKLQRERNIERSKEANSTFKDTFGKDWRDVDPWGGIPAYSKIPLRIREQAISRAAQKTGYAYSSPAFKSELENEIDNIYDNHSVIDGDNGGSAFIPAKLNTDWLDWLTDWGDVGNEDESHRQRNILNGNKEKVNKSLQLLIKEGNAQAVIKDLVFAAHFDKLSSSLGANKAAAELGKLEQSLHITQDGYAMYTLGNNSITLSPNDMKNIINDVNQYSSNESKDAIGNWELIKDTILGNEKPEETKRDNFNILMDNINKYIPYYQSKAQ